MSKENIYTVSVSPSNSLLKDRFHNCIRAMLFFLFLLLVCTLNAQMEYDELQKHNAETIELIYADNYGNLFGKLKRSKELKISKDNGLTWSNLLTGNAALGVSKVVQTSDDNYFVIAKDTTYKMNTIDGEVDHFYTRNNYISAFKDLLVLPSGDILFAVVRAFWRIDGDANLIDEMKINPYSIEQFLGIKDDTIFVSISTNLVFQERGKIGLLRLDTDFNLLDDLEELELFDVDQIEYINGRFYSNISYSDDGVNWVNYPNDLEGKIVTHPSGKLSLITEDSIHVSLDGAQTFNAYSLNIPFTVETFLPYQSDGLILSNYHGSLNCETSGMFYSEDGIDQWKYLDEEVKIGLSSAHKVKAFDSTNIYIGSCEEYFDIYRSPENSEWKKLVECDSLIQGLEIFDNGIAITQNGCKTENYGRDWESGKLNVEEFVGMRRRQYKLYVGEPNRLNISDDFGESWSEYIFDDLSQNIWPPVRPIDNSFDMSVNDEILTGTDQIINRVNLDGENSRIHLDKRYIYLVAASRARVGNSIYFASRFGFGGTSGYDVYHTFGFSHDNGQTFTTETDDRYQNLFLLFVDHLDNVYYGHIEYKNSRPNYFLHMSKDGGQSWINITPTNNQFEYITDVDIGNDNHIYISTNSTPILRSKLPVTKATIPFVSNSNELIKTEPIEVFPNPFAEQISISVNSNVKVNHLSIVDLLGREVAQLNTSQKQTFDLKNFKDGMYFILVNYDDNKTYTESIIKIGYR